MMMTKHRMLLNRVDDGPMFTSDDGDTLLAVDLESFIELGRPAVVTLTVEPGDRLNGLDD